MIIKGERMRKVIGDLPKQSVLVVIPFVASQVPLTKTLKGGKNERFY